MEAEWAGRRTLSTFSRRPSWGGYTQPCLVQRRAGRAAFCRASRSVLSAVPGSLPCASMERREVQLSRRVFADNDRVTIQRHDCGSLRQLARLVCVVRRSYFRACVQRLPLFC